MAAENGHLNCLKWARDNGCSWDKWTWYMALRNSHSECVTYAMKNKFPQDFVLLKYYY